VSTQIPEAIDRLYALFTTALPAADDLTVADGPQTSFPTRRFAVVGGDGPVDEDEEAARATQEWKGIGKFVRDEAIDVTCAVGASTGNAGASVRAMRQEATALLKAIEDGLRADPGLGGFTTGGAAAVTEVTLRYPTNIQGTAAVLVFTINVPVRSRTGP
jgi:hypothetical protein